MAEAQRVSRVLLDHFFRRFFDSDTREIEAETLTTVVRALAATAVPSLMVAFFLQSSYPGRTAWGAIEDQYFFVLFSFVVLGSVTLFEWEMLFPDRWDFLILSPLPIRPLQMLRAKSFALLAFLALFLVSSNLFGILLLPAISKISFYRHLYAHAAAVLLAGTFAALFFLGFSGILLCVLGARRYRSLSPLVQMLSVTTLLLLIVHYAKYSNVLPALLTDQTHPARFLPPLWFLGVYEQLLHGDQAPAFAPEMTRYALRGTLAALALVVLTYPLAWARMRTMAIEGTSQIRPAQSRWSAWLLDRILRTPGERGILIFIGQTLARNNHYQVYLALYAGSGLGLALACALSLRTRGATVALALSNEGLHAVLPLLLFWIVAGLRAAFAFPLNLPAGWIFRITTVPVSTCAGAARRWVRLCAGLLLAGVLALLVIERASPRVLFVQLIAGLCLCTLLVDLFFALYRSVPFNQPRLPGRTSLPLVLTLYLGLFPLFVFAVVTLELQWEHNLIKLLSLVLGAAAVHLGVNRLRTGPDEVEEEMQGYEGEFQLLNLS